MMTNKAVKLKAITKEGINELYNQVLKKFGGYQEVKMVYDYEKEEFLAVKSAYLDGETLVEAISDYIQDVVIDYLKFYEELIGDLYSLKIPLDIEVDPSFDGYFQELYS